MAVLVKVGGLRMAGGTRDRMIDATVDALRRNGVAGMSFTDVLRQSGAARGAIYHHFPGGKAQLIAEAAERFGAEVRGHLAALPGGDPEAVVEAFVELVRPVVAASATGSGCTVAAVSVGSGDDDALRQAAGTAFGSWTDGLAARLVMAGAEPEEASGLAALLIAVLEGAQVLCRAAGDTEPFERAARTLRAVVRSR
ncbi:TetR/AcrR family transcriptional regulator [Kitasatospora sp. NPDC052896]|uniref:TetR/AcrR family transcriptional regulator n=1 Tax=Kitasatospora sp. NPDC052896 TaxID=3364061 RepID=UPI0037C8EBCA